MTATTAETKHGTRRYSPTRVTRQVFDPKTYQWATGENYGDATVQDLGSDGMLDSPRAMLRAYSNDPEWHNPHGEHFVCDDETVKHYGQSLRGYVLDADGDVALYRVMGHMLSRHAFGHAHERYTVLVSYEPARDDWNGWGNMEKLRIERWTVMLAEPDEVVEALKEMQ